MSERERKLASSQQSPFQGNITTKIIIPNKKIGRGYDPFAFPVEKHKTSALTNWLKKDRWYRITPKKKPARCPSLWYWTLRTPLEWLTDSTTSWKSSGGATSRQLPVNLLVGRLTTRLLVSRLQMDAFINVLRQQYTNDPRLFRSERMCILDHAFSQWWTSKYSDWVSSEPDANGLGRRLPGGVIYMEALYPHFAGHVDDVYAPVNYKNNHWLAIWKLIPRRHIVVWDRIVGYIRQAQLDQPFTYEVSYAPQCESGYCGLFALKYIECHALGLLFPGALQHKNIKPIREQMAVDIFEDIPDAHRTEVTDIDVNQGMYD
ncbi:hypothetical protein N665_0560s0022 [Sinapis alba]|nr:hypothetical protein N665_0560s0022 [Sinapis alba]